MEDRPGGVADLTDGKISQTGDAPGSVRGTGA